MKKLGTQFIYIFAIILFGGFLMFTETASASWTCGSQLVDSRDSQSYATVQIGTQCWMKQNINVGTMTPGANDQGTSNSSIQKYCYDDDPANCVTYGGLYQWDQMMTGSTDAGAQGICPVGWHIPSNQEWATLEQSVCVAGGTSSGDCDTAFPNDDTTSGWRGTSANEGISLQSGGTSGFDGLLAGARNTSGGSFFNNGTWAYFWTSTQFNDMSAWFRNLYTNYALINQNPLTKTYGYSVRCLQTSISNPTITSIVPSSGTTLGGTSITITGTGFVAGATVTVGGVSATNVDVVNGTSIIATTPAGTAGAVDIIVTNSDTSTVTSTSGFTYILEPTIDHITPSSGTTLGGTSITITGTGFVAGATVTVGGVSATNVDVVNGTTITATSPTANISPTSYGATWNAETSAGSKYWQSVSMSKDGKYQTAATYGIGNDPVYTSSDYGTTWAVATDVGLGSWQSVSLSSSGQYQTAVAQNNYIFTSSDYGASWTANTSVGSKSWKAVSLSGDGKYQTAVNNVGYIYTSSDYGANWIERTNPGERSWYSVSLSGDGKYQTAVVDCGENGYIYTSSDYGATWIPNIGAGLQCWQTVSLSGDGKYQTASGNSPSYIYTSSDYGTTWAVATDVGLGSWQSVSLSSSGQYQTAVGNNPGYIYTSSDYGASWTARTDFYHGYWISASLSGNGKYQIAAVWGGYIYTSSVGTVDVVVTNSDTGTATSTGGFTYNDTSVTASSSEITTTTGSTTITLGHAIAGLVAGDIVVKVGATTLVKDTDYTLSSDLSGTSFDITFLTHADLNNTSVIAVVMTKTGYLINGGDPIAVATNFDITGPTGTISNGNGTPTNSVTPTLNLTIADAGIGITGAQMQFSCNPSTAWSTWESYATPKTNFNIRTGAGCTDADGSKTVYVEYKDSLGNIGSSYNTGTFTLDTSASFATLSGTPASITKSTSASVTVAGTNIVSYEYKLDSGSYGVETVIATPISLSSLADGSHTLSVIGKNSAGTWQVQGSATTYTWTVDTTAPVVTFSIPATSNSLTITFTSFSATDANTITGYLVNETATTPAIDNTGWSGTAQTQYIFSNDGAKTLYAWAKDSAENISTSGSGSITITIPITAHTITASSGTNGSITPSGSVSVNNGSDQAFTITPNSGYHIDTVTADSVAVSATSPYTFTNVIADHTISATFAADPAPTVSHSGGGGMIIGWNNLPIMPAGGFKVFVNSGASTTTNRIVNLNFNAGADIKKMAISLTGDFNDASQENYSPTKQIDLCSKFGGLIKNPNCPNGKYTIYTKFYTISGIVSQVVTSSITLTNGTTNTTKYNFTRNLSLHATGADVKALQQFLNANGFVIAKTGAGSPGKETNLFGSLTYKALVKFQKSIGWSGTGFFGPMTRDYIANH